MSLSKKMAGKIPNQKKTRGRPKMEFVSQKPKIKRDKPGRPRKETKPEINIEVEPKRQDIRSHKIPENEKRKDGIILGMFIFSLILFTSSLYFSQKKQELLEGEIGTGEITGTLEEDKIEINTQETMEDIEGTGNQNTDEENIIETQNTILLGNFYNSFNKGSILNMYPNIDNKLISSKLFKIYFSKMRIQRFLRNISSEGISISEVKEKDNKLNYLFSYTLKDGHYFEETREIEISDKDIPKIGKIMCISTGCSKLPFFNPGKYNLK